jgi:penicillin amidase
MEMPKRGFLPILFSALLRPFVRALDRGSAPEYSGIRSIPGLRDRVRVHWQSHGIPHVYARDEHDLFLAQGYLHAQERLWQMDMGRRFLGGRLAEIFGNFAVPWRELMIFFRGRESADIDYFMRLLGLYRAARASVELLPEDHLARLTAYSEGINRYIERCGRKLPWEFRVLRYEPEPWRPADTILIGKGFAFLLTTALFSRLDMIAIAGKLRDQPDKLRSLFPMYPEQAPTITRAVFNAAGKLSEFANGTFTKLDFHPAGAGSNNWVVAPKRSVSGKAILCNDPHLRLSLPAVWYLMHLKAEASGEPYEVWGATIPGVPCVQVGRNRSIAWGITAAVADDAELYQEKIHPLDADRYLAGHEWLTMESRVERIAVRREAQVEKIVRSTRHGPVISDFNETPTAEALSFRWVALEATEEFCCVYGINSARNWDDFLAGLRYQSAPNLNYAYADGEGNIGYALGGKIPLRPKTPSLLPLEGWRLENDWPGYISFDELPRLFNPTQGVIATANNRVVEASYPHYLSHFYEPPYRIRRIEQLLSAKKTYSPGDMAAIHLDVVSLHARHILAPLKEDLTAIREASPALQGAATLLLDWDGTCDHESAPAALFHVLYFHLRRNLLEPVLGTDLFIAYSEILNQCMAPVDQVLQEKSPLWFSDQTRADLVSKSLRDACDELSERFGADLAKWQWGKIHSLIFSHSLARLEHVKPLLAVGPFPSGGDGTTVSMGFYRHSNPYEHTVGASLRCIIDFGDWQYAGFVLPPGQSGHIFSRHFKDQVDLWRSGQRITMHADLDSAAADSQLLLEPGTPR